MIINMINNLENNPNLKFDENFNSEELDLPFADTIKNIEPDTLKNIELDTLRSSSEEETFAESGIITKNPDQLVARGTVPLSSDTLPVNAVHEKNLNPVANPPGFEVKAIPEWEIRTRGTIQSAENENLPPYTESVVEDAEERKAS